MKDDFKKHFILIGNNVREIKIKNGWTQDDLANRCTINTAKISKIESAREDYMMSTLIEISKALKVSLKELFEE